ncbi:type I secretion system permease/ATPase [Polynucleobacter sp. MWH-UH25E]|uniref:type I secretion system permease/ATPase n=1 Tax=Polynucleobacter sp. MWH-UH25E TaxID=1855616 RepID=UPI001BFCE092|nr:type I secretion system permease/ATPase [Polynucleobacter sp. MWH-UH25E]QWD61806.1 type I secretion system permease/ATPase [Polynucleobacter sp. MWH-UH25E]
MQKYLKPPKADNEILVALYGYKKIFRSVGFFTACMNLLLLVPSIYMLEVYDRVLTSRNEFTLLMLSLIILFLYVIYAALDAIRSHTVIEVGKRIDAELNHRTYTAAFEQNLKVRGGNAGQALNDLTTIRQFVTGPSLYAFFDAPWFPFYLIVIFLFNGWLGLFSTVCVLILIVLAFLNESVTHQPLAEASTLSVQSANIATNNLRQAEVLESMGMLPALRDRWYALHSKFLEMQAVASQRAATMGAMTKFFRTLMQSLALGFAAFLVLENKLSPGMMIAATILLGKATSPVEMVIGSWKQWRGMISSYERLKKLLEDNPPRVVGMSLQRPKGFVSMEGVYAAPPGIQKAVLKNINFAIEPGDVLGVIGPSASGKSTLARVAVGIWPSTPNAARIDGADVYRWNKDELGPAIGYMPQDIEVFPGTVSENIARFTQFQADDVIEAAQSAGVHDMILHFPEGYDTRIGDGGIGLSGGQKQRLALARALFGKPSVIVLDEPNSNLDEVGEAALVKAIIEARNRKATVIVITHRMPILQITTKLLLLQDGNARMFGPSAQVMQALQNPAGKTAIQEGQTLAEGAKQVSQDAKDPDVPNPSSPKGSVA